MVTQEEIDTVSRGWGEGVRDMLLEMARIFIKLRGFLEVIQIDGESTLSTSKARDWVTGKDSTRNGSVFVCELYNQYRIKRMWQSWK